MRLGGTRALQVYWRRRWLGHDGKKRLDYLRVELRSRLFGYPYLLHQHESFRSGTHGAT